jgi:hypothetical protein
LRVRRRAICAASPLKTITASSGNSSSSTQQHRQTHTHTHTDTHTHTHLCLGLIHALHSTLLHRHQLRQAPQRLLQQRAAANTYTHTGCVQHNTHTHTHTGTAQAVAAALCPCSEPALSPHPATSVNTINE